MRFPSRTLRALAAGFAACALLMGVACNGDAEEPSEPASGFDSAAGAQPTEATTPLPSEGGAATPDPGGGDTVSLDPCALVTHEEAEAALGEPVTEGEPSLVGEVETCTYSPEGAVALGSVQVAYLTRAVTAGEFPGVISEGGQVDLDPITQIGDAAFWDGDQVVVLVGEVALSAIVIPTEGGTSTAVDREASIGLARLAAERLP